VGSEKLTNVGSQVEKFNFEGVSSVKRTSILVALVSAGLLIISLGCGQPAKLKTITLTGSAGSSGGFYDVKGAGGTLQLTATGNYNNNATENLTDRVTYTATPTGTDLSGFALPAPPQDLTVSSTGLVTAVTPFVCTYHNAGTDTKPSYVLFGSYQIVATSSNGTVSQPIFIGVASEAGDGPSGACGP
jgi:hypothetical protein